MAYSTPISQNVQVSIPAQTVDDDTNWVQVARLPIDSPGALLVTGTVGAADLGHLRITRAAVRNGTHVAWLTDDELDVLGPDVLHASGGTMYATSAEGTFQFMLNIEVSGEIAIEAKAASDDTTLALELVYGKVQAQRTTVVGAGTLTEDQAVALESTLSVAGNVSVNTDKLTIAAATGNTAVGGTLAVTGAATLASTLGVTGNVAVNTNKFNVTAASGNTAIAGTLAVTGAATLSSTLAVTGNVTVNTDKFTVTASSGNTAVGGTLAVTGATTLTGTLAANDHITLGDAKNIVVNATTGTKIGTATTQKLGFFNATPVVQPAAAAQAALTDSTGGSASDTLAAITAGESYAQEDMEAVQDSLASLAAKYNALRTALVNLGLIKGAA